MTKLITPRVMTAERRDQIVAATLRVLAHTPVDALTTRQLAAELGLTQPALFRHFRSRDELLLAVVDHARGQLEGVAVGVLEAPGPALVRLRALGEALLEHAQQQPGLPRLLFASSTPEAGPVGEALRHLVSMQAALVAELVRRGQGEGDVEAQVDADVAASLFVDLLQGLVRRWEAGGRTEPLPERFAAAFALWRRGVAVHAPAAAPAQAPARVPAAATAGPLAALDVRPLIARGVDPLAEILAALAALPPAGALVLTAPFRPAPLLSLLSRRGHAAHVEELEARRWVVEVVVGGAPAIEDLRDLEPPGPLERVLQACEGLAPGGIYLARLPRYPSLLVPQLRARAVRFALLERGDGPALLRVERAP